MLYRANRLAPLVLNLPQVCRALGDDLKTILDDYWAAYPKTNVHFIAESYRFCEFLRQELCNGRTVPEAVEAALSTEMPPLSLRLSASYTAGILNRTTAAPAHHVPSNDAQKRRAPDITGRPARQA